MKYVSYLLKGALEKNKGVFRLFPNWIPRIFSVPGKRLKLYPNDYYAFGFHRGGITERWFASTIKADNGPETLNDEGLSWIYIENGAKKEKISLKDSIKLMGEEILGSKIIRRYGEWNAFAKFFDNLEPIPFHLHQDDEEASKTGKKGKPEAYFFPEQLNNHYGNFPYTFFGLNSGTTKEDIKNCLLKWKIGDNEILNFSKAYHLKLDTGWDVPSKFLHAPGSLLTYEIQRASDVSAIFQSLSNNINIPWSMLVKDVPAIYKNNLDYIVDLIDWDTNLDTTFYKKRFLKPKPIIPIEEMKEMGYEEYKIIYKSKDFSAKKLIIYPRKSVTIKENSAYGIIVIQGVGKFGALDIETPTSIKFGEMTNDELFVTVNRAREGVLISNTSNFENLVMLKHFGPEP